MKRIDVILAVILFFALMGVFVSIQVSAQDTSYPPNIWLQVQQDSNGYYLTCQNECDAFNTLGTPEELNKHFEQAYCTVNWYYAMFYRKYGIKLEYLVGPNGDTSNPLCQDFGE